VPEGGAFVSVEDPPPAECAPNRPVSKGLARRLTGTAMRRDRLPEWLKPRVWPIYFMGIVLVVLSEGIIGAVGTVSFFAIMYLLGFFLPLRMAAAGFEMVTRPLKGVFTRRLAHRVLRREDLVCQRLNWSETEWTGQIGGVAIRVLADAKGVLVEGRYEIPIADTGVSGRAYPHRLEGPDSFLLEDRVVPISDTWRRTGDPDFENWVQVTEGRKSAWLPALLVDASRRQAVVNFLVDRARAVRYRCEIEGQTVRARRSILTRDGQLRETYDAVLAAATALNTEGVLSTHLGTGAANGSPTTAKQWCLGTLLTRFNTLEVAKENASAAHDHPDPVVQLWAVILTETRSTALHEGLIGLGRISSEDTELYALVLAAIHVAVGTEADHDVDFLDTLTTEMCWGDVRVELLKQMATTPWGLDALVRLAWRPQEPMRGLVFQLLRDHAQPRFEDTFIGGLDGPNHIQSACVVGLKKVGTVRAVAPLIPVRDKIFGDSNVRALARETIQEIQGRLPKGAQGQLTLVDHSPEVGAVSFALAEEGGMSLASEDPETPPLQPLDADEM